MKGLLSRKTWVFALVIVCTIFTQKIVAKNITVDFKQVDNGMILDSGHNPRAQLMGKAKVESGALDLGGVDAKGVADFGKNFALSKTGTIEFRCNPRKLSGIIVGKNGAINIEFVKREKSVRFGLKFKGGARGTWVNCKSSRRSVKINQWVKIKASWGKDGLLLFLDDKLAARAALPASFDWFSETGRFILGSYTWAGGYKVWFFDGLIDDFSFSPTQEAPPADSISVKSYIKPQVKRLVDSGPRPSIFKLLLKNTPKPNYGVPVPEKISGCVTANSRGIANVSVTDGFSVVKTDSQGMYTLKPDTRTVFIYITKPSGYDVAGAWYKPVSAEVNFELKPAPNENEFIFAHITDTHISSNRRSVEGLSRFVQEMNSLKPVPRFVINSGDLVNLSKTLHNSPSEGRAWFSNYTGIMNHLKMPYYNVSGDHTDSSYRLKEFPRGDIRCGKPMFWEYLGPNVFSFEYGKIHFICVDYVYHLGKRQINGKEYPTSKIQPEHVKWLNQDMADRTKGTFVVTASEHDLCRHYPGFIEMARQNDVRLQLTGDDHIVANKTRFVPYRTGGALAGCWWNPKTEFCPDLSPRGYMIYRVSGENMEYFYKGLGQRVSILSPRYGAPLTGNITIQAHIVQPKVKETLQYTLNGKDWKAMREIGRPFYRVQYEAKIDSALLADGLTNISVKSSLTGETRSRKFVVVNSNKPTAFDSGAKLTLSIKQNPKAPVKLIFNSKVIGSISPSRRRYSFNIPASELKKANTLRFSFSKSNDGMKIFSPVLIFKNKPFTDPKSAALWQVRNAHWGSKVADNGGFVVGDGKLDAGPFFQKQNTFCFVL